jgi:hypothetical protein
MTAPKAAHALKPRKNGHGSKSEGLKLPGGGWLPHPWQQRVIDAFKQGKRRFLLAVHRRAGKDQIGLNLEAIAANMPLPIGRVGTYLHVMPYEGSVRDNIWKGQDKLDGRRFIDQAFPESFRAATREHAMEIEFVNGSFWRCVGSDNYNALRGGNPIGVVFSEYAFADPQSWTSIIAPILRENGGWAMFISTPNGRNHFYDLYQVAMKNPDVWHVEYLTVDDTQDAKGKPLITAADIEAARLEDGLSDADVRREFYCDWHAVFTGAYYGKELDAMRQQQRIGDYGYEPGRPVFASWDLGHSDDLVVGFWQQNGNAHRCIASRAWQFTKFEDALGEIDQLFPWKIKKHVVPHDAASRTMRDVLIGALEKYAETYVLRVEKVQTGIEAVRQMMPTLWIDSAPRPWAPEGNNKLLIDALAGYRTTQSVTQRRNGVFSATPQHSWESHWADMVRYYAMGVRVGAFAQLDAWGPAPNYSQHDRAVIGSPAQP